MVLDACGREIVCGDRIVYPFRGYQAEGKVTGISSWNGLKLSVTRFRVGGTPVPPAYVTLRKSSHVAVVGRA